LAIRLALVTLRLSNAGMIHRFVVAAILLTSPATLPAQAASAKTEAAPPAPPVDPGTPAPYDDQLLRLSEILGSVTYLRHLCAPTDAIDWRQGMQKLLDTETRDEPKRKERLTGAFNRGYRSFASVYTDCTPQAMTAEQQYRNEGATLAAEITARFGN
jgi:uncharacterized protein (TIGR02301 family)